MSNVLTERQQQIYEDLGECLTDKAIAARRGISERRVRQLTVIIAVKLRLDPSKSARAQIAQRAAA